MISLDYGAEGRIHRRWSKKAGEWAGYMSGRVRRHGDRQVIAQRAGVYFLSLSYITIYIIAFWAGVSRGTILFL